MNKLPSHRTREQPAVAYRTGKDEMNLLEHSFSSASTRGTRSVDELLFEWSQQAPETHVHVRQRLSISFSSKFGRPSIEDDQVYVGLLAITHQQLQDGHDSPRIEFTRYQLVNALGWPDCGASYENIDRAINRLGGVWVVSDNAFYDRRVRSWVDTKFHIIDESHLFTRERYDLARETTQRRPKSWIRWGGPLHESIANGNLATFDLDVYRAINGGVAKKLYRYSNKRLYKNRQYAIDLRELAEQKLGFKSGQAMSELRRMLTRSFDELKEFGFGVQLKRRSKVIQVIVSRTKPKQHVGEEAARPDGLEKELIERGVDRTGKKSASKLVSSRRAEHIREQIENYDDRLSHNEQLGIGWLVAAIESEKGFACRKGFKSSGARKAEAAARRKRERVREAERVQENRRQKQQQHRDKKAFDEFIRFRDSFSEAEQIALENDALAKCEKLVSELLMKARRSGEVSLYHQIVWEQHIIPNCQTASARDSGSSCCSTS